MWHENRSGITGRTKQDDGDKYEKNTLRMFTYIYIYVVIKYIIIYFNLVFIITYIINEC